MIGGTSMLLLLSVTCIYTPDYIICLNYYHIVPCDFWVVLETQLLGLCSIPLICGISTPGMSLSQLFELLFVVFEVLILQDKT